MERQSLERLYRMNAAQIIPRIDLIPVNLQALNQQFLHPVTSWI